MHRKTCVRCGYNWLPRIEGEQIRCPKCSSKYWNKPRKRKKDDKSDKGNENSEEDQQ
jgi:DNA-directed RNA polymerase subunit RPC12/RpoP